MQFSNIIGSFNLILILASTTDATSYLLSCGAPVTVSNTNSTLDGRTWYSDNNSTFSNSLATTADATTNTIPDVAEIPYSTARIFSSKFSYSFPVSPGPKFIRLYFYPSPSPYSSSLPPLLSRDAYLTVESNSGHILLKNFSAFLSTTSTKQYIEKEFYVHVTNSPLQLTLFPTPPSSFAFVNGIEVVSVPDKLYVAGPNPIKYVSSSMNDQFPLLSTTALETSYRVNVGGNDVGPVGDAGGLYRRWETDDGTYLSNEFLGLSGLDGSQTPIRYTASTPNYSAPNTVYQTFRSMGHIKNKLKFNLTWDFELDLGFHYLVRLHWCEVLPQVNTSYYRVFDVYIDEQMADEAVDIFILVGGFTAYYKDYVVYLNSDNADGGDTRRILELAMHPNNDYIHMAYDTLLNGVEIFKINGSDGGLYAPNPKGPPPATTPIPNDQKQKKTPSHVLPAIIGAVFGAFILSILLCFLFIIRRRKLSKKPVDSHGTGSSKSKRFVRSGKSDTTKRSGGGSSSLPSHLCHYFSLEEIRLATSDFSDSLIIGHGGFGNVYKGTVNTGSGPTTVAIKRLNPLSNQGAREFAMEIQLLSKLRHLHLVSLIGYCDAAGEMILIYEYMSHGTLRDHLFPHNIHPNAHLPWPQRLLICVGAARGLHYLHTGTERMVIHRDVKSTNILLDERWVAKVSDFGLSKLGPTGDDLVSHVSTVVKGSFGYVDPEYYRRQQLTEKSDVYSFGVVLFEVLCGRAAVNPNLPKEQVNLRIWARRNQLSGTLDAIVDPMIMDQISPECLRKFGDVAESCVRDEGVHRPSMADVIAGLELAIQIQSVAFVPKSVDHALSRTTTTTNTADDQVNDDLDFPITSATSPTTDTSVRLIKSAGESTWTSMNNSSMLFSNTASEPYGGSTDVFSQIFKADGR